ncbi:MULTISPECIES: DUF397 domain-containing protein [Streptomyces]|uniref:DUF397 domain-containing protein n=1 Tax=Streptomyces cadmiisoli TaxID=2184053 RepID=A0A2Z4JBL7_9ACTN|nr:MULTISPECIES: DUF397 domain-containing protein [Streptomyces]AWW35322.1 DUF397 domain-containing protein [Streptomyces cadmiisoli]AWW42118.1 DUF397 domain-containing protein [Streptomyces cadmiisoli]
MARSDACPTVPVRDSKNPTDPAVDIGADAWTPIVNSLRQPPPSGRGASNLVTGPRNWSRPAPCPPERRPSHRGGSQNSCSTPRRPGLH